MVSPKYIRGGVFFALVIFSFSNGYAVASSQPMEALHHSTPTKKLALSNYPEFVDDLNFQNYGLALQRQIDRFREKKLTGKIRYGRTNYPKKVLLQSVEEMLRLVSKTQACVATQGADKSACVEDLNATIKERFDVYIPKAKDSSNGRSFFTAYYTPLLKGTSRETEQNKYAVYLRPEDANLRSQTREEIDFDRKLMGNKLELGYFPDPFDLYLLHVQGGGRLMLEDERKMFYISYDGTNKQAFKWISVYMRDKGYIDNISVEAQRKYLEAHPEKHREIFSQCPSYVYFKITETPPLGSDNVPLTDFRSIATDYRLYKQKGTLAFVKAVRPIKNSAGEIEWKPFSRFYIDQDTGGAIKGAARADLYFGEGKQGEFVGTQMAHYGNMYFLVLKKKYIKAD